LFEFVFNKKVIAYITITDHYQENHPEITNELILKILEKKFNGKQAEPTNYPKKKFLKGRLVMKGGSID
jgi:hypothetical protein